MKLGYTEFSFGYAFTENLIRSAAPPPAGAPFFPNIIQEGQFGYDVCIDLPCCPLFFQYKMPELLVRNSAAEISQHSLAGISVPFFRMPLMRRNLSQQHQLLVDLENRSPDTVYYATPGMEEVNETTSTTPITPQMFIASPFYSHREILDRYKTTSSMSSLIGMG